MTTEPSPEEIEQLARKLHAMLRRARVLDEIRNWDARRWKNGQWVHHLPGLNEAEKAKWRALARDLRDAVLNP
jgi:hypothetical protein